MTYLREQRDWKSWLVWRLVETLEWLGPAETVYGKDGIHETPYLTRVRLSPALRSGQLILHIFHRGDADPDPHDHPFDFWTFPLSDYVELETLGPPEHGMLLANIVDKWQWHKRPAEYTHIVCGLLCQQSWRSFQVKVRAGRIWTIVWRKPARRPWGFWVKAADGNGREWMPWRQYVYGQEEPQ